MSHLIIPEDKLSHPCKQHKELVNSVSFSPDGKTLASGSKDTTIILRNLEEGTSEILSGHNKPVWRIRYSPELGNMIASASLDKTVKLWKADTKELLRTLSGHKDAVVDISFSPDSTKIATASWDGTIKLWDTTTGQQLYTLEDLANQNEQIKTIDFTPNGDILASGGYQDGSIKLWDLNARSAKVIYKHEKPVNFLRFSPDGKVLASGSADGIVKLWNIGQINSTISNNEITEFAAFDRWIYAIDFSSDSKLLAVASTETNIKLWKISQSSVECKIEIIPMQDIIGHDGEVYGLSFHPNSKSTFALASGSLDETVRFWNQELFQDQELQFEGKNQDRNEARENAWKQLKYRLSLAKEAHEIYYEDRQEEENNLTTTILAIRGVKSNFSLSTPCEQCVSKGCNPQECRSNDCICYRKK